MSDENRVPFFGLEVERDALVKLFFHAPMAGEADLSGGVVRSGPVRSGPALHIFGPLHIYSGGCTRITLSTEAGRTPY